MVLLNRGATDEATYFNYRSSRNHELARAVVNVGAARDENCSDTTRDIVLLSPL